MRQIWTALQRYVPDHLGLQVERVTDMIDTLDRLSAEKVAHCLFFRGPFTVFPCPFAACSRPFAVFPCLCTVCSLPVHCLLLPLRCLFTVFRCLFTVVLRPFAACSLSVLCPFPPKTAENKESFLPGEKIAFDDVRVVTPGGLQVQAPPHPPSPLQPLHPLNPVSSKPNRS